MQQTPVEEEEEYSIHPLLHSSLPTLAQFVQDSKLGLTINRVLVKDWPNLAAQKEHYTKSIEANFENEASGRWKVVVGGGEDGEMVGHLVLTRVGRGDGKGGGHGEEGGGKPGGRTAPGFMNDAVFAAVMDAVEALAVPLSLDRLELTHIYIAPSHRRHGLGSRLLQLAISKAEEAGVPLMLASEPEAHGFFVKRGFADRGYVDIDLAKWAEEKSGFGIFRLRGMEMKRRDEGGEN
ncbi:hypothetical protein K504DRAFT_369076 [Pleomassaria siparia CBS 279.74]|uniref:N-acetyltransferase domain-containing protein n=1 Tax=Pleomassaria siparia CBS 279.74 TaxID=1314801 RepID=A0A6G1KKT5_9PLEO|nr:hypothetical protein K504DRAFT_369076 [Pleomassaria siparia CBS 279.74]